MKDIVVNQVWEDKEGYHWLIVGPSTDDGFKCKCTYIPKKRHLVGRYRLGQLLDWEYDGKESDIFFKMIKDEYGNPIEQKKVETVKLKKTKEWNGDKDEDESYISDVYEPDGEGEGEDSAEDKADEQFKKKIRDQRATSPQNLDEELEKILVHINSIGDENTEHKIDFSPMTKARLLKEDFLKLADKALFVLQDINLGKQMSRTMLLTTDDLADINKATRVSESEKEVNATAGQIWERQLKFNKPHGERIKIIFVKDDLIYAIRALTPDGKVPTYSMCQTMTLTMLKNYFFNTDEVSKVSAKELGQFPTLQAEYAKMNLDGLEAIGSANFDDLPIVKRLNSSYSDRVKALQKLIKIRFKILSDL